MKGGVLVFKIGDKVIYGQTGVCEIIDICKKEFVKNQKKEYYCLKPIFADNNMIYAPTVDSKIFMRSLINREQAENLIEKIPSIVEKNGQTQEGTKEEYLTKINNHTLEDLVELTAFIYSKKKSISKEKKRLNNVDEKYMKIGENLLFGELALVLDIPLDEVQKYIENRLKKGSIV